MNGLQYSIKIDAFEGPLDLLLHLIQRLEIDIYEISVAEITKQYMDYIHAMQELKLDIASDYLVMAAQLLEIKSGMLLPSHDHLSDDQDADDTEHDPTRELVQRLIEYRKYKEAAQMLKKRESERGIIFTRPSSLEDISKSDDDHLNLNVSIYDMMGAYQQLLQKSKEFEPKQKVVSLERVSLRERINEVVEQLQTNREWMLFEELFSVKHREAIIVTFLAVLELVKQGRIICRQDRNFTSIYIKYYETEKKSGARRNKSNY